MNTGGFWVQSLSATAGAAKRAEDVEIFRCITNNSAVVQGRIVPRTSSPSVVIVTRDCTRRGRGSWKLNACCFKWDESRGSHELARKPLLNMQSFG
jgi:hypothetical protein